MNRKKLLIENFFVYGLGGVINKIIPFIMLPVITYLLPNETYFGINDLFSTISSFCCAFGVFGMTDTAFRFFFDSNEFQYRKNVCSTTLLISFVATSIVGVVLIIFRKHIVSNIYGNVNYGFLIELNLIYLFCSNIGGFFSLPTRMLNQRKIYVFINLFTPVITYGFAILFILRGLYISALPIAAVMSAIVMGIIFIKLNGKWFNIHCINVNMIGSLIKFGLPLLPQHLMYYVINSSDKLMIASMLGQSYNGIYAVGAKFGHLSQLIYTAFSGGWTYYRYATMNADDQVENVTKIYELLGTVSLASFSIICIFSRPLINIFFKEVYHGAYIVIPYLFLAPLVQMLFQTVAGQFSIQKNNWINLITLMIGTVSNVILNYFLIERMGIEGAAIATLVGYMITTILATVICIKSNMLRYSNRFLISVTVTVVFYIIWRTHIDSKSFVSLISVTLLLAIIVFMYKDDVIKLIVPHLKSNGK